MELLSPEDRVQVFMHGIKTATMDAVPAATPRLDARRETPNGRRSCQLQSGTPKNALLMEASRKAGREPSHRDRQEKNKPGSKKSAANPGRHKQKYPSSRNKCCQ